MTTAMAAMRLPQPRSSTREPCQYWSNACGAGRVLRDGNRSRARLPPASCGMSRLNHPACTFESRFRIPAMSRQTFAASPVANDADILFVVSHQILHCLIQIQNRKSLHCAVVIECAHHGANDGRHARHEGLRAQNKTKHSQGFWAHLSLPGASPQAALNSSSGRDRVANAFVPRC